MGRWTKERLIAFEKRVIREFKARRINCPLHLSGGNEEPLIEIFKVIRPNDWVVSTHRNHYHYLLKGGDPKRLMNELKGRVDGVCGGCGRSMHLYDSSINFITSGIVAGSCAIACGIALGVKYRDEDTNVWAFLGDAAEDSGHFFEALRYSISMDLPMRWVIEDNDLSIDVTKKERWGMYIPTTLSGGNVIRYTYKRRYPHVGVGTHISF